MDDLLRRSLLASNPWLMSPNAWPEALEQRLPRPFVARAVYAGLEERWRTPEKAHLLVGPRQVGKTTLLWKHACAAGPRTLGLVLEDMLTRHWCRSAPLFLEDVRREFGPLDALILDEIQHLPEAALFVKQLVDLRPGYPLLVSGSSAFHLQSRTRESLAGRATRTTLLPFSARELAAATPAPTPAAARVAMDEIVARSLRLGGYPDVLASTAPEQTLRDLVETFLLRDASDFFRIQRPDAMRRLLALVARQAGQIVNQSEWASLLGVSRDTVREYLQILEDAHLLRLLPVFAGGKRAELTASHKVYLVDNGLRAALLGEFRDVGARVDAGPTVENWVFGELHKDPVAREGLHYWRTRSGAEVDFVIEGPAGLLGIEVKAGALTRPTLSRSARSFIDAYAPLRFLVVNGALSHTEHLGRTLIEWLPRGAFAADPLRLDVTGAGAAP